MCFRGGKDPGRHGWSHHNSFKPSKPRLWESKDKKSSVCWDIWHLHKRHVQAKVRNETSLSELECREIVLWLHCEWHQIPQASHVKPYGFPEISLRRRNWKPADVASTNRLPYTSTLLSLPVLLLIVLLWLMCVVSSPLWCQFLVGEGPVWLSVTSNRQQTNFHPLINIVLSNPATSLHFNAEGCFSHTWWLSCFFPLFPSWSSLGGKSSLWLEKRKGRTRISWARGIENLFPSLEFLPAFPFTLLLGNLQGESQYKSPEPTGR